MLIVDEKSKCDEYDRCVVVESPIILFWIIDENVMCSNTVRAI